MLKLGIRKVHQFVEQQIALGNNVRWNGWTIEFFRPAEAAIYNAAAGIYRDGQWGYLNTVSVNDKGLWEIDFRNIKRAKKHQ